VDRTVTGATPYQGAGSTIISAVFADHQQAHQAVDALRELGISDDAISVAHLNQHHHTDTDDYEESAEHVEHAGEGALAGAGVGAAVGAVFGLAAAAIPGVGPFVTAGALGAWLGGTAGAAASGAIVGSTSGALAGAISRWGVPDDEARFYAGEVERGGAYVGVDISQTAMSFDAVRDVLRSYGGRFA
jgi:hypothetical protein